MHEETEQENQKNEAQAKLGKLGEELACEYLLKKGHNILQRNFKFRKAEVDIISEFNGSVVFTEVKTRFSSYLSDPSLLVPLKKQKQIIRAADEFVKTRTPWHEWRFDIMLVITNSQYTEIEHIEDAFYPMV